MVHIKPKTHNKSMQIWTQLQWHRPHALDLIATPPMCLQKGRNSCFLF